MKDGRTKHNRHDSLLSAFAITAGLALLGTFDLRADQEDRGTCPVTHSTEPEFVPPTPFPAWANGGFFFGSPTLWTIARRQPLRGAPDSHGGYRFKWPWFAAGLSPEEKRNPGISVTGRRLDGDARPLTVEGPGLGELPPYYFFASVLVFPTTGCWEITATRKDSKLRLVVWLEK